MRVYLLRLVVKTLLSTWRYKEDNNHLYIITDDERGLVAVSFVGS